MGVERGIKLGSVVELKLTEFAHMLQSGGRKWQEGKRNQGKIIVLFCSSSYLVFINLNISQLCHLFHPSVAIILVILLDSFQFIIIPLNI